MATRILLTGATGFVGPLLGQAILRAFSDVQLLAVGGKTIPSITGSEATFSALDSRQEAERLAEFRPDIVVHLAALSSVAAAASEGHEIMAFNLGGTLRLARAFRAASHKAAFVFASSGEVYGKSFLNGVVDEATALQPSNAYARSKAAAEYALSDMLGTLVPVVLLRLFNHTGPGQDERFVVPSFAAQIARIEAGRQTGPMQVGNLAAERDFLDVADVVDAYIAVLREVRSMDAGAHAFNVCSSQVRSIQSVLDSLMTMSRVDIDVKAEPARMRPSDIPRAAATGEKFQNYFGWKPNRPFEQTLADILTHWRKRA